jgi:hypothetical protein
MITDLSSLQKMEYNASQRLYTTNPTITGQKWLKIYEESAK